MMLRKLTLAVTLAATCMVGNQAVAQTDGSPQSAGPKVELASYARDYSSGCIGCQGGGGYSTGGYAAGGSYGGPQAMGAANAWGAAGPRDCSRFYHYPYVYYPQNFRGSDYYRSSDSMYYRYPKEMQIPVYNRQWQNYYPSARRYHWGHQFILDVF